MAVTVKGKNTKQLREERATLYTNAQSFLSEHEDNWTDDRQAQYQEMLDDVSTLKAAIERRNALANVDTSREETESDLDDALQIAPNAGLDQPVSDMVLMRIPRRRDRQGKLYLPVACGARGLTDYRSAFSRYLRQGAQGLSPEQFAALQSDNAEQAGYLTASEQFATGLLKDVDDLLFVRRYATVHTVREAASLGIRKRTAKANTFGWSAELQVSTDDSALKFGKKALTPHHLTGEVKVSRDLIRRAVMDIDMIVRDEMSIDADETMEDAF